jgi:hypothetical protein
MGKRGFKRFGHGGAAIAAWNSCSELLVWLTVCMPSLAFRFKNIIHKKHSIISAYVW